MSKTDCDVFEGLLDNQSVAIKSYTVVPSKMYLTFHARKPAFDAEAERLRQLAHPNMVPLLGTCALNRHYGEEILWLVLARAPHGNLCEFVGRTNKLSSESLHRLVTGIAEGLQFVHAHGYAHRRLSPSNVVVTLDGVPQLIDFNHVDRNYAAYTFADPSIVFAAPEIFDANAQAATESVDVDKFSFAMLAGFLLTHRTPRRPLSHRGPRDRHLCNEWLASDRYARGDAHWWITETVVQPRPEDRASIDAVCTAVCSSTTQPANAEREANEHKNEKKTREEKRKAEENKEEGIDTLCLV